MWPNLRLRTTFQLGIWTFFFYDYLFFLLHRRVAVECLQSTSSLIRSLSRLSYPIVVRQSISSWQQRRRLEEEEDWHLNRRSNQKWKAAANKREQTRRDRSKANNWEGIWDDNDNENKWVTGRREQRRRWRQKKRRGLDNKRNKDVFPFSLSLKSVFICLSVNLVQPCPPSSHDCTAQPSNFITDQQQKNGKATIYRLSGSLSSKLSQQQQHQQEAMRKTLIN